MTHHAIKRGPVKGIVQGALPIRDAKQMPISNSEKLDKAIANREVNTDEGKAEFFNSLVLASSKSASRKHHPQKYAVNSILGLLKFRPPKSPQISDDEVNAWIRVLTRLEPRITREIVRSLRMRSEEDALRNEKRDSAA